MIESAKELDVCGLVSDLRIRTALERVPRREFLPEDLRELAHLDRPLPIGHRQTISQPAIVVTMTEAVQPKATDRCLEIGTGSGYQTAVLAELCREVFSIECLPELAAMAAQNLSQSGGHVHLRIGNGAFGWPEHAPFDVIVVTAAPEEVPAPLLAQLALGGRLVIPLGAEHAVQRLELWTRVAEGSEASAFERRFLADVRFVPFVGERAKPSA